MRKYRKLCYTKIFKWQKNIDICSNIMYLVDTEQTTRYQWPLASVSCQISRSKPTVFYIWLVNKISYAKAKTFCEFPFMYLGIFFFLRFIHKNIRKTVTFCTKCSVFFFLALVRLVILACSNDCQVFLLFWLTSGSFIITVVVVNHVNQRWKIFLMSCLKTHFSVFHFVSCCGP